VAAAGQCLHLPATDLNGVPGPDRFVAGQEQWCPIAPCEAIQSALSVDTLVMRKEKKLCKIGLTYSCRGIYAKHR